MNYYNVAGNVIVVMLIIQETARRKWSDIYKRTVWSDKA